MINEIVKKHGAAVIAEKMAESVQTVCNWLTRGVPADKVLVFCIAVDFEIKPHELRPDLYPHPEDGLPAHLRHVA